MIPRAISIHSILYDVDRFRIVCNTQTFSNISLLAVLQVLLDLGLLYPLAELRIVRLLKLYQAKSISEANTAFPAQLIGWCLLTYMFFDLEPVPRELRV